MQRSIDLFQSHIIQQKNISLDLYHDNMRVVQVKRMQDMGRIAALQFLAWVLDNPEGVISFPTGKTPHAFISALSFFKDNWHTDAVQQEVQKYGIVSTHFPHTQHLKFVQMDEFFLMHPGQRNSFSSYIKKRYVSLLEIQEHNVLFMDFSKMGFDLTEQVRHVFSVPHDALKTAEQKKLRADVMRKVQDFAQKYEEHIIAWGGIGFFLGGIGPDGHIAFNMPGSDFASVTRIVALNYPSAAAAAVSLGGIEYARNKLVMTIGLGTILHNPDVHVVCMAAGEAKAEVVAHAISGDITHQSPGSVLQRHAHVTWLLTHGAACKLPQVQKKKWQQLYNAKPQDSVMQEFVISTALQQKKKIVDMELSDFAQHPYAQDVQTILPKLVAQKDRVVDMIEHTLASGLQTYQYQSIVHTAPHHDDVMLSYYPYAVNLLSSNKNVFLYATSGFNSVTNSYMQGLLKGVDRHFVRTFEHAIFQQSYQALLQEFAQAYEAQDGVHQKNIERIIAARKIVEIFDAKNSKQLLQTVEWLWFGYFNHVYPGKKDIEEVQVLKGAMRESEVDRMWALSGIFSSHVVHLRSRFYTGDYFTPQPTIQGDAQPLLTYLAAYQPHIVTVALDPEGTGPDTHYKVLQIVGKALELYHQQTGAQVRVWGYRNVWHRFALHEATKIVLVDQQQMQTLERVFLHCFSTQKNASFPALHYDGPFSGLMQSVLTDQYQQLQTVLGEDHDMLQGKCGAIYLKDMDLHEFLATVHDLSLKNDMD